MKLLVTGASGLLGINFCLTAAEMHDVSGLVHSKELKETPFHVEKCDLMDQASILSLIQEIKPDWLIHCAALANVDACEANPKTAQKINTNVPGYLSAFCFENNIGFVHISTDAVFDGKMGGYKEGDEANPLSVYARTKLAAEELVLENNSNAMILRVNFYGYSITGDRSLAEFFINNLKNGSIVNGFVDVMFCPLYVRDLVDTILQLIEKPLAGIVHVVSPDCLSKYTFGVRIAEKFGWERNLIHPQSVYDSGLIAKRSPRLTLKIERLENAEIIPPRQDTCIDHLWEDYQNDFPKRVMSYYKQ